MKNNTLIVLSSFHHNNTRKIAEVIAATMSAKIVETRDINIEELKEYDLIGFGSGIYDAHHHQSQLNMVDALPVVYGKHAFIFSTTGAPKFIVNNTFIKNNHSLIRKKLEAKGYIVIGEFGCRGWNTNKFLKYFGGLNKGHPNNEDLSDAEKFAETLSRKSNQYI